MTEVELADRVDRIQSLTVWRLANLAGCAGPDTETSAGARFLVAVADAVVEMIQDDAIDDEDRISEIADGAPDVYTFKRWLEFVDLAAWNEDPTELVESTEDMTVNAGVCLYLIAERLVRELVEMVS